MISPKAIELHDAYLRAGFVSPVRLLSEAQAHEHRERMEEVERRYGRLHYVSKVHTIVASAAELASNPRVLDVVEQLIGPDILLFDVTYIVKEASSATYVSWHQDLTYWGFSGDDQVSMWLALSPANETGGCMRMLPGSHLAGQRRHIDETDTDNVLHRGQRVAGVDEANATLCELQPGEASFHHGWTLHTSGPNRSADRRIGLNVQYIAPTMRQLVNPHETALCVRGTDRFRHYAKDTLATTDLDPVALARHSELDRQRKETWSSAIEAGSP